MPGFLLSSRSGAATYPVLPLTLRPLTVLSFSLSALSSSPSLPFTRRYPLWTLCLHPPGQPARPDSHPASFNCSASHPPFFSISSVSVLLVLVLILRALSSSRFPSSRPFFLFPPRFLRNTRLYTSAGARARYIVIMKISTARVPPILDTARHRSSVIPARFDPSCSMRTRVLIIHRANNVLLNIQSCECFTLYRDLSQMPRGDIAITLFVF